MLTRWCPPARPTTEIVRCYSHSATSQNGTWCGIADYLSLSRLVIHCRSCKRRLAKSLLHRISSDGRSRRVVVFRTARVLTILQVLVVPLVRWIFIGVFGCYKVRMLYFLSLAECAQLFFIDASGIPACVSWIVYCELCIASFASARRLQAITVTDTRWAIEAPPPPPRRHPSSASNSSWPP